MDLTTQIKTRKKQRKESRKKRKREDKRNIDKSSIVGLSKDKKLGDTDVTTKFVQREKVRKTKKSNLSALNVTNPELEEAIQRDEAEIAELEKRLGIKGGKNKDKLHKEYAKLEGFGDDFGEFLDDLDDLVERVRKAEKYPEERKAIIDTKDDESQALLKNPKQAMHTVDFENVEPLEEERDFEFSYANLDPSLANALHRDDEEIADLEQKLGLSKRKEKEKLYKEYSKLEGYGDDFGDFLDDLDHMTARIHQAGSHKQYSAGSDLSENSQHHSDESDEEILSMAGSTSEAERIRHEENGETGNMEDGHEYLSEGKNDEENKSKIVASSGEDDAEPDHDIADTYHPSKGEDIYGNKIDSESSKDETTSKYVPPHLRAEQQTTVDDEKERERKRTVLRSLNNSFNRLSEDTLISVAQQVAKLYTSNPTQTVHELIWKNAKDVCITTPMLMIGLIPVYTACITGVHIQTGDTVQIGENILEKVVVDLLDCLKASRGISRNDDDHENETENKQIGNLILFLGYLYNYGVVHCSFVYDIIRHLIENFSDADVECLLVLLKHCGRTLRSDDPKALEEIVLLIQKTKSQSINRSSSSRTEYMVSAIIDLKNNKRKREDNGFAEKISKFRKILGRIKASTARSGKSLSEVSLRITLKDVIEVETKGRWWKVGASWVGNQYRFSEESKPENEKSNCDDYASSTSNSMDGDEELLKLAAKFRMNTDRKRSIFCIIMGGSDCEDTFEKLCRSSMLQNRAERDTVRVLMECCGNERSYNKFYGHLAARICEYQPQSRFSLQLAYWDLFKQFGNTEPRKGANLAKLLFHLVVTHRVLKIIPVIRPIDLSDEDMDDVTLVFLTIVLSSILEHFEDQSQAKAVFARRVLSAVEENSNDDADEGVRAGLLVFFMDTLKSSPKNIKKSRFRKNLKAVVKELDTGGFEDMF